MHFNYLAGQHSQKIWHKFFKILILKPRLMDLTVLFLPWGVRNKNSVSAVSPAFAKRKARDCSTQAQPPFNPELSSPKPTRCQSPSRRLCLQPALGQETLLTQARRGSGRSAALNCSVPKCLNPGSYKTQHQPQGLQQNSPKAGLRPIQGENSAGEGGEPGPTAVSVLPAFQ